MAGWLAAADEYNHRPGEREILEAFDKYFTDCLANVSRETPHHPYPNTNEAPPIDTNVFLQIAGRLDKSETWLDLVKRANAAGGKAVVDINSGGQLQIWYDESPPAPVEFEEVTIKSFTLTPAECKHRNVGLNCLDEWTCNECGQVLPIHAPASLETAPHVVKVNYKKGLDKLKKMNRHFRDHPLSPRKGKNRHGKT